MGRSDGAIECFDEATKINPRSPEIWNNEGYVLNNLNAHEAAIGCYDKALSLNPMYGLAWRNKGSALEMLGYSEEAAECYNNSEKLKLISFKEFLLLVQEGLSFATDISAIAARRLGPDGSDFYEIVGSPEINESYDFLKRYYELDYQVDPIIEHEDGRSFLRAIINDDDSIMLDFGDLYRPAYRSDLFDCSQMAALLEYHLERCGIRSKIALSRNFTDSDGKSMRHAFVALDLPGDPYYADLSRLDNPNSEKLELIGPGDSRYNQSYYIAAHIYNNIYELIKDGLYKEFAWWNSPVFMTDN